MRCVHQAPPFSLSEAPEIIGTAFYFNFINRVVDEYLTTDLLLPDIPGPLKFVLRTFPDLQVGGTLEWYQHDPLEWSEIVCWGEAVTCTVAIGDGDIQFHSYQ